MRNGRSPLSSAAWSSMTVVELKAELKERGLKVSGKKAELIERLSGSSSMAAPSITSDASPATAHCTAKADVSYSEHDEPEGRGTVDASSLSAEAQETIIRKCATLLKMERWRVAGAIALFDDGSTMPFIARYRKESTGGMDETELRALEAALDAAKRLEARRASILSAVQKLGKLTAELKAKMEAEELSAAELEDLYLPFRAKRRTKASLAREAGLQPLANAIMRRALRSTEGAGEGASEESDRWAQYDRSVQEVCTEFAATLARTAEVGAASATDVLRGACEIVAEEVMEEAHVRAMGRNRLRRGAVLVSKEKKEGSDGEGKFRLYHAFRTPLHRAQPHQVLAINRGEALKVLNVFVEIDAEVRAAFEAAVRGYVTEGPAPSTEHASWRDALSAAIADGTSRLLLPALEREWRRELTDTSEEQSFSVFSSNLRQKLLQPPLKGHVVAAIDPGLRTGCKVAVVTSTGSVLATDTLMLPLGGGGEVMGGRYTEMRRRLIALLSKWTVTLVAIGNGTGSREATALVVDALTSSGLDSTKYLMVDESGASVYSASKLAVAELPDMDVSLRGAVSLARRVQDPLSELVKVDPKSLGVGMYQHDVDQRRLADCLDKVVESAVNAVGVDLNVASAALLARIAGLNAKTAQHIVEAREAEASGGRFGRVEELTTIKGIGPKAYEQAAGFLRIYEGMEPLDATAVHPESYTALRLALERLGGAVAVEPFQLKSLSEELGLGVPTLADALEALQRSGSDPRDDLLGVPAPILLDANQAATAAAGRADGGATPSLADLEVGDELLGVVKNVVDFGAFVDIGIGTDGLLHSSEMRGAKGRSAMAMQVGKQLRVKVKQIEIQDLKRKKARIGLGLIAE